LAIALKEPMVRAIAARIPVEWEVKLGETLMKQVEGQTRIVESAEVAGQFRQLTAPLVGGIPDQGYRFEFRIVEDSSINAFAMPGGGVVVHSGLLLAAEGPEEVAGVLAHELAHVTLRHGMRKLIESAGPYLVVQAFLGDVTGILAAITDNATFLLTQKFSRDFEREADDAGWAYLEQANIDPRGMIRFFERLEAERQKLLKDNPMAEAEEVLGLLSTHPATRERIETLRQKSRQLQKKSGYIEFSVDFAALQEGLRAQLRTKSETGENQ